MDDNIAVSQYINAIRVRRSRRIRIRSTDKREEELEEEEQQQGEKESEEVGATYHNHLRSAESEQRA